jgi:hypothetical protein
MAFNEPVINDKLLAGVFDISRAEQALTAGKLNGLLAAWSKGED